MKQFMDQDFLLTTKTAQDLFHNYAENMPIIDYHCHINPQEIFEDRKFKNITEAWLGGDHYKWRIMRACGVDESYVTGNAPDREKFKKYAESLAKSIGNPLYHWSHLELQRYFGISTPLNAESADAVYDRCNEILAQDDMSVRNIIRKSNVKVICTTDDPADSLEWHRKIAADETIDFKVYPAWRPDKAMNIEKETFLPYIETLSKAAGMTISTYDELIEALKKRMEFFASMGCSVSDHGIDYVAYDPADPDEIRAVLVKRLNGEELTASEVSKYKSAFMLEMGRAYAKRNWVMQLHYSVKRNNNSRMYKKMGPDTGFDAVNNYGPGAELADFLNALEETDELPKTVVYSLNPIDNVMIESIIGCFQDGKTVGKMQHGSAWWFNDNKTGMIQQLTDFANEGVLGTFIGMLTDSRSFLSYTRHEYFRRILCELIGGWVENGEYPNDETALKAIIEDICYNNTKNYFGF